MKKPFRILALISICVFLFQSNSANAQKNSDFQSYWYLNASGGLNVFFGDVKQNSFFPANAEVSEWKFGGGWMLGRQFSPIIGLRGQTLYGQLAGSRRELGIFIEGDYIEFNLNATFSLSNLFWQYNSQRKFDLYAIAGLGLTNFNMNQKSLSDGSLLKQSGHNFGSGIGGRTLEGIAIAGIGLDYKINDKWSLNFESALRGMNSDKVDIFENGKKHDYYSYTSLGITFKFGHKTRKKDRFVQPVLEEDLPKVDVEEIKEEEPEVKEEVVEKPVVKKEEPQKEVKKEKPIVKEIIVPDIPEPEYRVQIRAAYQKRISKVMLSEKFKIPVEKIKEDRHRGYYIYSVGSYATYEEAGARRDELKSKHGVYDAFVVCFSKGSRLHKLPQ